MVDTLHPPSTVILSWPKPNYINPETRGPGLVSLTIALSAIAIVIVAARLYCRLVLIRTPGWDDALTVVSLGFAIGLSVLVVIGNSIWLTGHHIWDIPPTKLTGLRLNTWISQWFYVISSSAARIAVLLVCKRIPVRFGRRFVIATWVGIAYNTLYAVVFCLVLLLLCTPTSAYWNSFAENWVAHHSNYHCNAENVELPLSGVFSVIGDLCSALPPMWMMLSLGLPPREKFGLYVLFSMVFFVVGTGIARTVAIWKLTNLEYDFTWLLWEMWMWAILEVYVAIIAASLPTLKPLFRRHKVRSNTIMQGGSSTWLGAGATPSICKPGRNFGSSERNATLNFKHLSLRESALIDEPEDIGLAIGGPESPQERFDQDLIEQGMSTRHFELRQSRDGKMVPIQVWKPATSVSAWASNDSLSSGTTFVVNHRHRKRMSAPQQGQVRNFSHVWRNGGSPRTTVYGTTSRKSWRRSDLVIPTQRQRPFSPNPVDFSRSCPDINTILSTPPAAITRTYSRDSITAAQMSPLSVTSSAQLSGTTARGDKTP